MQAFFERALLFGDHEHFFYIQMFLCFLILTRECCVCPVLETGRGPVRECSGSCLISSMCKRDQGRIDHFCSLISLDQQSHFLEGWRWNHIPRWSCDKRFPTVPAFLPTCQGHHPPSLMDKMVLLWECCSYHIVWTGLNWNGSGSAFYGRLCWEGKFAPVWNWHYIYREQGGKQTQRLAHWGWLLPKLLTKDICEAVIQSGGMWKWAPAESPSKMTPLGCEPRGHNLFALFMHSSSLEPLG